MTQSVVIVDDSLTVRMDLADAFNAAGFLACPCSTVAEGRAALSESPASAFILDVLLPDGDGVGLLQEIRESPLGASAVVVMLSSEAEAKDRMRGLQTGADEYVGKPYDADYVVARVQELLRARERSRSGETTVLVIEDSVTFRESLRETLESAGYRVITATTGELGLRVAAAQRPDAIVIDGVLPDLDGATVIRHIRLDAALRDVPCVLLTGSGEKHSELKALDAGADTFLRKEEDVDIILAKLVAVIRRTRPRSTDVQTVRGLRGPKKILAVDDSVLYLHELMDGLKGEGYDILLARSGEEAIELLAVQSVDCILLDLVMPGLGGQETCERVKSAPLVRDIPLIMLTAREDREAMIQALAAGADDYIQKSAEFDVLKARVRAQIRRKQSDDENRRIREALQQRDLEALEAGAARRLAETRATLIEELEWKNKELEAFSSSVSHDLRAPLRAVSGFSAILRRDFAAGMPEGARALLDDVHASAQRMEELIDGLLLFSRMGREPLTKSPVDIVQLVHDVVAEQRALQPERSVEVRIGALPDAVADPLLLKQVLINLLSNAFKFTRHSASAVIEVSGEPRGGEGHYSVRDNGVGFDPQHATRLFGVFQRLHRDDEFEGSGVGLSLVQRIIQRHGGRVWAEAAVNRGATFHFTLPGS